MTGTLRPVRVSGGKLSAVRVGAAVLMTVALTVLVMRPVAVSGAEGAMAAAPTVSGERLIANPGFPEDVASDGTNFLVVSAGGSSVIGVLVSPTGEVLAGPMPIAEGSATKVDAAVAWSGTAYGVVWEQFNGQQRDIHFAEVSATGSVSAPTPLVTGVMDQKDPALVYAGSERWLAYLEDFDSPEPNSDVTSIVLATTGSSSIMASVTGNFSSPLSDPAFAWDDVDNRLLTAWNNGQAARVDARRFDVATRSPTGAAFPIASVFGLAAHPAVAWNGSDRWAVVWDDHRFQPTGLDVYGTLVHADGTILANGVPISKAPDDQGTPDVAWNTQEFIVIWRDRRSGATTDIYGTTLASDGTVEVDAFVVAASGNPELGPTVTAGPGTKVGLFYGKTVDGVTGLYFRTSPK